jgi:ABC-2 type transport system permease protein
MAATTLPIVNIAPRRSLAQTLTVYAKEARYELTKNVRIPVYAISTVTFPLMFYVLFGIVLGRNNAAVRNDNAVYMLGTMGCFGVMAVALFGFGVSLAIERGQGWLQVKRASPMPIGAYFFAKLFAAVAFSTVIILLLLAVGFTFGGVRLPVATAATSVVNLIYLPMSFCSGLWIPLFLLPHGLQTFAKFLPPYHLAQLALGTIGMTTEPATPWSHIEALIGFTIICLGVAAWGYRRDEGETYG